MGNLEAGPYRKMFELACIGADRTGYSVCGIDHRESRKLMGETVTPRLAAKVVFRTDPWQARRILADAIATRARDARRPA